MRNYLKPNGLANIGQQRNGTKGSGNSIPDKIISTQVQEKPTFQHIRVHAKTMEGQPITRQDLATLTGLSIGEVYVIDIGGSSSKQNRQKVVPAFNQLTGQSLTMNALR
jgi:hypothetical protein